MKNLLRIIFILVSILVLPEIGQAYFNDSESGSNGQLAAGTLSFTASATTTSGEAPVVFEFAIDNTGTHNPDYTFGVSTSTCSGVSFLTTSNTNPFEGTHGVTVSGTAVAACSFTVLIEAWQDNLAYGAGGFTDSKTIQFYLTVPSPTSGVVINEFLPNPEGPVYGSDSDNKPKGEWVELYNTGSTPVDLSGWYVTDASGGSGNTVIINASNTAAHLSPATTIIPANGYLVVYMNKPVFNNSGGDSVRLFNAGNSLVDSYSYSGTVADNKTFARVPDGGTWVDPIPSPGESNLTTVTREDLLAEGWSEAAITAVLGSETQAGSGPLITPTEPVITEETANPNEGSLPTETIPSPEAIVKDPEEEIIDEELLANPDEPEGAQAATPMQTEEPASEPTTEPASAAEVTDSDPV